MSRTLRRRFAVCLWNPTVTSPFAMLDRYTHPSYSFPATCMEYLHNAVLGEVWATAVGPLHRAKSRTWWPWDVPKDVPGAPASRPIDRQFIASVDAAKICKQVTRISRSSSASVCLASLLPLLCTHGVQHVRGHAWRSGTAHKQAPEGLRSLGRECSQRGRCRPVESVAAPPFDRCHRWTGAVFASRRRQLGMGMQQNAISHRI